MRSATKDKFLLAVLIFSLLAPTMAWAEEDPYNTFMTAPSPSAGQESTNQNPTQNATPNSTSPITRDPVLGRVFGVQGSGSEIKYFTFDMATRSPRHAAIRSGLVPGWGQAYNGENAKGILFFVTTAATLTGSILRYNKSIDSYHDYKAQGVKDSSLYEDYNDERTQAAVLGGVAVIFYVVGIMDAYRHAYSSLYSQKPALDLAWSPTETRVVWSQKF